MTSRRNEFDIRFDLSPRLVTLKAPATEITVQDLHDTLRDIEQEPQNLTYPPLIASAGKENLGGSVSVGITSTLQNARLAFQAKKQWVSNGTITTSDTDGRILTDSGALFITDGIVSGSWVINLTDGSIATVLAVISETKLLTDTLGGSPLGNNQFNLNDQYVIMNIDQVQVSGGNLVAVDEDNTSISSVFPTAGNQVVRSSSSSATLRSQAQLEFATFSGMVTIDVNSPYNGTKFPVGTLQQPVNNLEDAVTIANNRGLGKFHLLSDLVIPSGDFTGKVFSADIIGITVTTQAGAITDDCRFQEVTLTGSIGDNCHIKECSLLDITYRSGFIEECSISGTLTLEGNGAVFLARCIDADPGPGVPTIDMDLFTGILSIREYSGGLALENKSTPDTVAVDLQTGRIIVKNTVTDGDIRVRGIGTLQDNSTGSASVDSASLLNKSEISESIWTQPSVFNDTGTFGGDLAKKDDVTLYESEPS